MGMLALIFSDEEEFKDYENMGFFDFLSGSLFLMMPFGLSALVFYWIYKITKPDRDNKEDK